MNLKFQSVFDIIGPIMIALLLATQLELFALEKLSLLSLVISQLKWNSSSSTPLLKPTVAMGPTLP